MPKDRIAYPWEEDKRPNRIYYWRKQRGMRQTDLADSLGVEKQTISKYEIGYVSPTIDVLRRLADVLDVAPADLLAARDNPYTLTPEQKALFAAMQEIPPEKMQAWLETVMPLTRLFAGGGSPGSRQTS